MMKVMRKMVLTALVMAMVTSQIVFASSFWTEARTWSLSSEDGYKTITTTGSKLAAEKKTDEAKWSVYTVSKTMITTPKARLVNSADAVRSDVLSTSSSGNYTNGSVNTGTIGYKEYLSVKPGALQVGVDTIKLKFKNY